MIGRSRWSHFLFAVSLATGAVLWVGEANAGAGAGVKVANASQKASSAPRREGTSFIYSDGTRVRASDPSGHEGKVQRDGSISYSDGTRVSHDPVTGESKIFHADGTVTRANPNEPRRDGDEFVYGDGVRVRAVDPSGKTGEVRPGGSIRYSDGTELSHDTRTGDTKIVHADGSVEVTTPNTPHRDGENFVWSDGQRARATDPNGNPGMVQADGSIAYSDGSRVSHDVRSGDSKIVHADGRVETIPGGGPQRSGDYYSWSDGVRAPATDPSGTPGRVGGDGWISYSDGTTISHDPVSGDSKIVRPDGTMTMGNTRTGETKNYDPAQERGLTPPGKESGKGVGSRGVSAGFGSSAQSSNSRPNNQQSANSSSPGSAKTRSAVGSTSNAPKSANSNSTSQSSSQANSQSSTQSNGGKSDTAGKEAKPAKEPTDKGKGRQVVGDNPGAGPGENSGGSRIGGVDLTGQPAPDDARGTGRPTPARVRGGVGPGGRPGSANPTGGGSSRLRFSGKDLVVNPNPTALAGSRSAAPIINAGGGRR